MSKFLFYIKLFVIYLVLAQAQINLVPDPGFDTTRAKKDDALTYFPDMMSKYWLTLTEVGQPRDTTSVIFNRSTMILNPYYHDYPKTYYTFGGDVIRKITPRSYPSCAIIYMPYSYYKIRIAPNHGYIKTKLKSPLKRDQYYYVQYYVKATCNTVYVSNIDLLFSVYEPGPYHCEDDIHWSHPWQCKDSLRYYPANPQIKNPKGRFITDSVNWTRICGVYKAEGNEQYITIGNFAHDRNTDTIPGDKRGSLHDQDWYLVDDVTVMELDFPKDTAPCSNQFPFTLYPSNSYSSYFSYQHPPGNNYSISAPGVYTYTIGNEACSAQAAIDVQAVQPLTFDIKDTTVCAKDTPVTMLSPLQNMPTTWYNGSQAKSITIHS